MGQSLWERLKFWQRAKPAVPPDVSQRVVGVAARLDTFLLAHPDTHYRLVSAPEGDTLCVIENEMLKVVGRSPVPANAVSVALDHAERLFPVVAP